MNLLIIPMHLQGCMFYKASNKRFWTPKRLLVEEGLGNVVAQSCR